MRTAPRGTTCPRPMERGSLHPCDRGTPTQLRMRWHQPKRTRQGPRSRNGPRRNGARSAAGPVLSGHRRSTRRPQGDQPQPRQTPELGSRRSVAFYRPLFSLAPKREVPGRHFALDLADGLSFLSLPRREAGRRYRSLLYWRGGLRARSRGHRDPRWPGSITTSGSGATMCHSGIRKESVSGSRGRSGRGRPAGPTRRTPFSAGGCFFRARSRRTRTRAPLGTSWQEKAASAAPRLLSPDGPVLDQEADN